MRNLCLFIAMIGLLLVRQPAGGAEATVSAKIQAYQLYDLQQYEEAAAQFKRHVEQHPDDLPAALDYASLLSQLKRYKEAARVLEGLHQKNSEHEVVYFRLGVEYVNLQRSAEAERVFTELERSSNRELAKAATEAKRRLQEDGERVARFEAERKVFQLAGQFKHEEVVVAVNELEKQRPLPFALAMQRLYALQSLRHYAQALELANRLALDHQTATDLALLRAELLAQIGRRPDAVAIWRQIERENADTAAADQAARRLQSVAKQETGERVFELARQQRHREVVEAIDEFEQQGDLSLTMERQRIYAWQALGQGRRALDRANDLAATHPADAELALLRAALLVEQDQWEDAAEILRQVAREHPGTTAALEAEQRLGEESARRENGLAQEHLFEQRVFDLAARQQHREAAAAVDAQEKRGELSWSMQMQRLYALQALGETAGALELADRLALTHPEATDLALLRADLLIRTQRWQDAAAVLKEVKREHRDEPVAQEAERRLRSLPPLPNLDRW